MLCHETPSISNIQKAILFSISDMLCLFSRRYYINYKLMKKKVRQYANQIQDGALDRRHVLKDFSHMLDNQVF